MVDISLPLYAEITYDWFLIVVQLYFMFLHYIRLRIQYKRASSERRREMFKQIDSRSLSVGVLVFALFVIINRFLGIVEVHGSCDVYLKMAIAFTVFHKTFNYQFILFRLKSQLKNVDPSERSNRLKWAAFYVFSCFIFLFETYLLIAAFSFSPLSERDDNRCNFSPEVLREFVPLYGGSDLLFSVILLFFFGFGLWRYRNIEVHSSRQRVKKTLNRIMTWSVIAICSTFTATVIAAFVDGASPIFSIGDTCINSICAVMQFAPINKDLDRPYSEQRAVFWRAARKQLGCKKKTHLTSQSSAGSLDQTRSGTNSTNFGIRGNVAESTKAESSGKSAEVEVVEVADIDIEPIL